MTSFEQKVTNRKKTNVSPKRLISLSFEFTVFISRWISHASFMGSLYELNMTVHVQYSITVVNNASGRTHLPPFFCSPNCNVPSCLRDGAFPSSSPIAFYVLGSPEFVTNKESAIILASSDVIFNIPQKAGRLRWRVRRDRFCTDSVLAMKKTMSATW